MAIEQWTYNGDSWQQFNIHDQGNGNYSIINVNSGKAIILENNNRNAGGEVIQWPYSGGEGQ